MKLKTTLVLGSLIAASIAIQANAQPSPRPFSGNAADAAQFADNGRRGRGGRGAPTAESFLERLDLDGDGFVSEGEFVDSRTANTDRQFERRDRDGDGFISEGEGGRSQEDRPGLDIDIEAFRQCIIDAGGDPDLSEDRFDQADLNGDGQLSLFEFSSWQEERAFAQFARTDTDMDGFITFEEMQASMEDSANLRRIIRDCKEAATDPLI